MRSRQLESTLAAFVEEAALTLGACTAAGEEVPFEVVAQPSRAHRTPLYCYRPLTGEFIREHSVPLTALATYSRALAAIGELEGIGRYVLARGAAHVPTDARERARTALRLLLEDVFDGQSDFELRPEQLRAALDRLGESAGPDGDPVTIVGTLHGVALASPEIALARGLTLASADAIEGAPEEAIAPGGAGMPHVLAVLTADADDPERAVHEGAGALRDLVRALRLFGDGRIALGALGWSRVGGGSWRPFALGTGGQPRGMLVVTAEQEDELRAFCSLVARRAPEGDELAWALERFHLGSERDDDRTALTDYLLALRALLEPEGPGSGLLAGRLAAICAVPAERPALAERVLCAIELERAHIRGDQPPAAGPDALVQSLAGHLRALLRDVICGHLGRDLVALADGLLLDAAPPAQGESPPEAGEDELEVEDWFSEGPAATPDERGGAPAPAPRFARRPARGRAAPERPQVARSLDSEAAASRAQPVRGGDPGAPARTPVRAHPDTLPF